MGLNQIDRQRDLEKEIFNTLKNGPQDAAQLAITLLFGITPEEEPAFFAALESLKRQGYVSTTPSEVGPERADRYTAEVYHVCARRPTS